MTHSLKKSLTPSVLLLVSLFLTQALCAESVQTQGPSGFNGPPSTTPQNTNANIQNGDQNQICLPSSYQYSDCSSQPQQICTVQGDSCAGYTTTCSPQCFVTITSYQSNFNTVCTNTSDCQGLLSSVCTPYCYPYTYTYPSIAGDNGLPSLCTVTGNSCDTLNGVEPSVSCADQCNIYNYTTIRTNDTGIYTCFTNITDCKGLAVGDDLNTTVCTRICTDYQYSYTQQIQGGQNGEDFHVCTVTGNTCETTAPVPDCPHLCVGYNYTIQQTPLSLCTVFGNSCDGETSTDCASYALNSDDNDPLVAILDDANLPIFPDFV